MKASKLVLYIGSGCSFCTRVLNYLQQNPMDIEIKDVWSNDAYQQELVALTGRTQVPCLRMGDDYMHESLDIIDKLKSLRETHA